MTERDFGTLPVRKVFLRLTIPNILSTLFTTLYIIVDGIFVGQYTGTNALAAVNLVMPIVNVCFALSDMLAIGSSVKVSTALGAREEEKACRIFSACIFSTCVLGVLFFLPGIFFLEPVLSFFIKDRALADLAYEYTKWYVWFVPVIMPCFALDNFLRISGKTNYSMAVNIATSLLNIFLDWLWIAELQLGIGAAAAASVASIIAADVLLILPFAARKVTLHFSVPKITGPELWGIVYNGSSEFFGNIAWSIVSVVINALLLAMGGSMAVAAYSIVMYVDSLAVCILYALGDAIQPAISYNVGAGKMDRTERFFRICGITAAAVSLVCMVGLLAFPRQLSAMFAEQGDRNLVDLSVTALVLFAPSYLFKWYNMLASSFLTALDRPKESITIMFFSSVTCPMLCLAILAPLAGVKGVFFAETASSAFTFVAAFLIWKKYRRESGVPTPAAT